MKRRFLGTAVAVLALGVATPARADALKESIYVLGVHVGNANGVLYGLVNSYQPTKAAHPNAVPLIMRQIKWSKELAENLGLATNDLTRLEKDLGQLSFADMQARFDRITEGLAANLTRKYRNKAASVFRLGAQVTKAGGVIQLGLNVRPTAKEAWRASAMSAAAAVKNTIYYNVLEIDSNLAGELIRRTATGTFDEMALAAEAAAVSWQQEFGSAPAWSLAPGTAAPAQLASPPPIQPLPPTAFPPPGGAPMRSTLPVKSQAKPAARPVAARPAQPLPAKVTPSGSFAGKWSTNWGDMLLTQSGSQVSGTYSHSDGSLRGTVTGGVLRFHWHQKGNGNKGAGRFTLGAGGKSFTGYWSYDDDPEKAGNSWSGTRK